MNKDSVRGESTWTCSSLKSEERARLWAYGTLLAIICSNGRHAVPHGLRLYGRTNLWRTYRASVIKVLDGDTVQLDVHLWPDLTQRINHAWCGQYTGEARPSGLRLREEGRSGRHDVHTAMAARGEER